MKLYSPSASLNASLGYRLDNELQEKQNANVMYASQPSKQNIIHSRKSLTDVYTSLSYPVRSTYIDVTLQSFSNILNDVRLLSNLSWSSRPQPWQWFATISQLI
jgi:hypothetical protein